MTTDVMLKAIKVVLGLLFVIAGIFMLVLPGPGIVFIFAGLYLIATVIPGGKERVERWRKRFNTWREDRRNSSRRSKSSRKRSNPSPQESASESESRN